MVLVGVSWEDDPTGQFKLEAVVLQKAKGFNVGDTFELGKFKAPSADDDLEGVTFVGGDIYAISESANKDFVVKYDLPSEKISSSNIKGARFGSESGFDAVNTKLGFDIQADGGSSELYRLTATNKGPFTKASEVNIKGFKSGAEFGDGLAVTNKNTFIVSDFDTADGDGNELYQFKFNNNGTKVNFVDSADVKFKGANITVSDSGLDFVGGKLYAVTDATNEVWQATSGVSKSGTLTGGTVTFTEVTSFSPEVSPIGEFEGLAVADLPPSVLI